MHGHMNVKYMTQLLARIC